MAVPHFNPPSAALFEQAKAAYDRIDAKGLADDRSTGEQDALVAVVFAAFTLEAFINEVGDYAAYDGRQDANADPQSITALGQILGGLKVRASIETKFQLARWILNASVYDQGSATYKDFKLLIGLRNALAHVKGLEIHEVAEGGVTEITQPPSVMTGLRAKNILAEIPRPGPANWVDELQTLAVARWACTAASEMICSVIDAMPNSPFRAFWRGVYDLYYRFP
jgi:hypothetical protein